MINSKPMWLWKLHGSSLWRNLVCNVSIYLIRITFRYCTINRNRSKMHFAPETLLLECLNSPTDISYITKILKFISTPWASYQLCKIAGCACAGNAGNVRVHASRHVRNMPESLNNGFLWSRWRGKRTRYSRRLCNPRYYVSGKEPISHQVTFSSIVWSTTFQTIHRDHRISSLILVSDSSRTWASNMANVSMPIHHHEPLPVLLVYAVICCYMLLYDVQCCFNCTQYCGITLLKARDALHLRMIT